MRRSIAPFLFAAFAFTAPVLVSSTASAGIEACGNINVSASAQCEVVASGGCTAQCTPISFTAACEGQCQGSCTASADVECTGTCGGSCDAECSADPGSFDCQASCEGNCEGNCDAACASDANSAQCKASCQATCKGECSASCEGTPPSASCDAKCSACCSGSCTAQANLDCQVSCQGSCAVDMQGGCTAQCESPKGALFCDGQYVDVGNNLDNCVAALQSLLNIHVEGYADGSASCSGGECNAEGEAGVSCAASPLGPTGLGGYAIMGTLAALGAVVARRRRRS
jgi:hypothetical protein